MRILVCTKRVPAPGARIVLEPDGRAIETKLLSHTISPHEECAVEEAVQITERLGGAVTVLTLGPPEAEEQLRSSLSVGGDTAVLLQTDGSDWDPISTSTAIVAAVERLEEETGAYDLLLFGNESADSGGYQVGIRVARALRRPIVSGIKSIEVSEGTVTARRDTETGSEIYRLPLPAVVAVKEGINLPRYPTLKGRLDAKKRAVDRIEVSPVAGGQRMEELLSPPQQVTETVILGDGVDAAAAVVDVLQELGLV